MTATQRGPAPAPLSGNLQEMLAALKQQSGQFRNDASSQAAQLEREFKQLRSAKQEAPEPAALSQTMPSRGVAKVREPTVGLQDLVERELKAQQAVTASSVEPSLDRMRRHSAAAGMSGSSGYRAQSVQASHRSVTESLSNLGQLIKEKNSQKSTTARPKLASIESPRLMRPSFQKTVSSGNESPRNIQITELHKELDQMDSDLQQSRRDNKKLKEDNDAIVSSHARDVGTLEHMLESVMQENKALRIALTEAHKGKSSKLMPLGVAETVERHMVTELMRSGISNSPFTMPSPHSNASASTETPPIGSAELDTEDIDVSRSSIEERFTDRHTYVSAGRR